MHIQTYGDCILLHNYYLKRGVFLTITATAPECVIQTIRILQNAHSGDIRKWLAINTSEVVYIFSDSTHTNGTWLLATGMTETPIKLPVQSQVFTEHAIQNSVMYVASWHKHTFKLCIYMHKYQDLNGSICQKGVRAALRTTHQFL